MTSYISLRLEKKKNSADADRAAAHWHREVVSDNVETARTPENEILAGSGDLRADIANAHAACDKRLRGDAVRWVETIIYASPEWFDHGAPGAPADREGRIAAWRDRAMGWLGKEFGDDVVAAVAHHDEATPHIHAAIVPRRRDKKGRLGVRAKAIMDGRQVLRGYQDRIAAEMADLGLNRGVARTETGAEHLSPREFRARQRRLERAAAADAAAAAETAAAADEDRERIAYDLDAARDERARAERERAAGMAAFEALEAGAAAVLAGEARIEIEESTGSGRVRLNEGADTERARRLTAAWARAPASLRRPLGITLSRLSARREALAHREARAEARLEALEATTRREVEAWAARKMKEQDGEHGIGAGRDQRAPRPRGGGPGAAGDAADAPDDADRRRGGRQRGGESPRKANG